MIKRMGWMMVLMLVATSCDARQRMRTGEVRQSGALPCFSIEDSSWFGTEQVYVAAIIVSEIDVDERVVTTTWDAGFTASDSPSMLSADTCIPYGGVGDSYRSDGEIVPVRPGKRYTVFINAHIRDGDDWENRRYRAYFCVSRNAAKSVIVRDVKWDRQAGGRNWNICEKSGDDVTKTTSDRMSLP